MLRRQVNEHKEFTAAVEYGAKEVDAALSRRCQEMGQQWNDIDQGWEDLAKKMADVGITTPSTSDTGILRLNVGGSYISVSRSVFRTTDGLSTIGMLADLFFTGTWDKRLPRDSDGRIVVDESPACVKHIVHTFLKDSGKGSRDIALDNGDAPADEQPILSYVSCALGLSSFSIGMAVTSGGSSILKDVYNVGQGTATIQGWCPGQPKELDLLYRASRDGWTPAAFHACCGNDSPSTITLIQVRARHGSGVGDSIVGGFSSVPWTGNGGFCASPGAFLFMLKDGSVNESRAFQPAKWDLISDRGSNDVFHNFSYGPTFGGGHDLQVQYDSSPATLSTNSHTYNAGLADLGLDGGAVLEIETFRVCSVAATSRPLLDKQPCSTTTAVAKPTLFPSNEANAEEHNNDIDMFGKLVAGSLMEERMALREAQIELGEAADKATASADAMAAVYGPDVAAGKEDPVVELSVRGSRMTTLLSTIQACPQSSLATMFNEDRWPANEKDVDEHGRRLIDCSPPAFAKVLDVLRMRKRASWEGIASQRGCDELVRVIIKLGDRDSFEEFVDKHFPGDLQSFIMDCVEPAEADSSLARMRNFESVKNASKPTLYVKPFS